MDHNISKEDFECIERKIEVDYPDIDKLKIIYYECLWRFNFEMCKVIDFWKKFGFDHEISDRGDVVLTKCFIRNQT